MPFKKGFTPWNKGGKNKPQQGFQKGHRCFVSKEKNSQAGIKRSGSNHWNWKGGITRENKRFRALANWKAWRKSIFERDNYTCQECNKIGGPLEPHHIIPIRVDKNKVFDIKNGITLCRPCHQKTIWKESNFAEKYFALVAAH